MKPHTFHLALLLSVTATGAIAETESPSKFRFNYNLSTSETPPNWTSITKYNEKWENIGDKYNCSNWSPSTSTQGKGFSFTQVATDCRQDQEKGAQDYRVNNINNDEVKDGTAYTIKQTITVSANRDAVGILENWLDMMPAYTDWIDTNALYGCTAWSPNPSSFTATTTFTQISSVCKTDQERQRQDREQERFTSEIRNVGGPVTEQQTLINQDASRSYSVALGAWTAAGEPYACSNWSPAASTIGKGVAFTQNATDCKLDQTRTRFESFKDHKTGQVQQVVTPNENRTLANQAGSRDLIGTLEQWGSTTPIYTPWVNTSALNACSNWAPSPASKTSTSTFTQTATNCTTDQTRTRQDREIEQYSSEIRNKGVLVEEAQTLTGQSALRSYTVTLGGWTDNGTKYGCTNWSPAASTVNNGQSFTQTATDCKLNQARTRSESYVDHKSGSIIAVAVAGETQTLSGQINTKVAIGTKVATVCSSPSDFNSVWVASYGYTYINWGGVFLGSVAGYPASFNSGGYKYTQGTYISDSDGFYTICRAPL